MDFAEPRTSSAHTKRPFRTTLGVACLLLAGLAAPLASQSPEPATARATPSASDATNAASEGSPLATLHVYTNLMQVPVLILTSDHERMRPIPEEKFRISLDGGPPFAPTHVRPEGDDPIQLALLIDTTKPDNELLPGLAAAVASLVPGSLRSWDRVSIYVLDCGLTRTALDQPPGSVSLYAAIERGLSGWRDKRHRIRAPSCPSRFHLFDAMAYVTKQLPVGQGRRALLVLTDTSDRESRVDWTRLSRFEQDTSTAVFGLRSLQQILENGRQGFLAPSFPAGASSGEGQEDRFDLICQSSGGVQFALLDEGLKKGLTRFVDMLRQRYIIEFPRSDSATAGIHQLAVHIPDTRAYVRSAGISVPLADSKQRDHALTLPSQTQTQVEGQSPTVPPPILNSPPRF